MPSGVVRALIFRERFEQEGYKVKFVDRLKGIGLVVPGFNRLYAHFSEWCIVRLAKRADVVYMSKVKSLPLIQRLRRETRARLVFDFGDALWVQHVDNDCPAEKLFQLVDAVTTDNEQTAEYVRVFNPNCTVIPDCPQIERFDEVRPSVKKRDDGRITIGWVGSPSTVYNLYLVWEALERLFAKHRNLHLRVLGVAQSLLPPFYGVEYSLVPTYDQQRMVQEVLRMDIGLFPMFNVEVSRVRGVLKAAVYMSGEAAVVSSPVGQCSDLIVDGHNGMLASSTAEWIEKLEIMVTNRELRRQIAAAALQTVRERFTMERSFEKLHKVFVG